MSVADDLAALAEAEDAKTARIVGLAIDRAHAHATKALTDALIATKPGRPTLRRTSKGPSYNAAVADLDGLWTRLAGPSVASLSGTLRAARYRLYRLAYEGHFAATPEAFRASSPEVTAAREAEVRGLVLHGYDLRAELGGPIGRAKSSLAPALEAASRPGVLDKPAAARLKAWADAARDAILLACRTAMMDAAVALDGLALVYATAPEHRPDDEYHPKG